MGRRSAGRAAAEGRVTARPGPAADPAAPGVHPLGLSPARDALLYVPPVPATRPIPLAVMLHGAGGTAEGGLALLHPLAEAAGLALLAPASRSDTWDMLRGAYGPDVSSLDRALGQAFARCPIDPARVAVGGFSDGASYALSIGLGNGDLFTHVIAFAPGFMAPPDVRGSPRVYVSHGTGDDVLPIDWCSRRLVPRLRAAGYDLLYREFDGPHTVPEAIAREAVEWFLDGPG